MRKREKKADKGTWRLDGGMSLTKTLEKSRQYREVLLPPAPDAVPWDEYKDTVSSTLQRQLGHRKRNIHGKVFVLMPKPKGTPWKLQEEHAMNLESKETVMRDDDSDDSDVDNTFDEIVEQESKTIREGLHGSSTMDEFLKAVQEEAARDQAAREPDQTIGGEPAQSSVVQVAKEPNKKSKKMKCRWGLDGFDDVSDDEPRKKKP